MACDDIRAALSGFDSCVETEEGSRVETHCLYPSFESVAVFVTRYGDGFQVHDGGGAARVAWVHGRDYPLIKRMISRQATRFGIRVTQAGDCLIADAKDKDWLTSAILAVANASASAAHMAVERLVSATEAQLNDKIFETLKRFVPPSSIAKEYEISGKSGKKHKFDYAVLEAGIRSSLIDAIVPHHISISAKYVAFSDVGDEVVQVEGSSIHRVRKLAVHDKRLTPSDESLLFQVAELVPVGVLQASMAKSYGFLNYGH